MADTTGTPITLTDRELLEATHKAITDLSETVTTLMQGVEDAKNAGGPMAAMARMFMPSFNTAKE